MRIDENFGTKENMMNYDSDEDDDYFGMANRNTELFLKTNNDLQNNVQTKK